MSTTHHIPIAQSPELFRREVNLRIPEFGTVLPDPTISPEGKLFVLNPGKVLYQLQEGVWETIP